ncbi:hypothetical protein F0562_003268 [Nyssa sinensis]|uniref:Aquaporin n=1 Tax=Nyssa sinensis TaxID=561372 RepID=A0A5J5BVH6_9ASTE|nr:hypothetical protein F0562_003268 [Nyssa sinensis]
MADSSSSPPASFPKPPLASDLTLMMEEGRVSPSHASTSNVIVSPTNAHKIIAELVGTCIIIFMGCGSIVIDETYKLTILGIAMTWGLAVMVMIYTLGHVSGGHFNPAVTIALAASAKFPWTQVPAFVAFQLAGSTLAIRTLVLMFHRHNNVHDQKITGASMNPARSIGAALVFAKFHHLWVYTVAPILGTVTACMIYSLLRPPMNEKMGQGQS